MRLNQSSDEEKDIKKKKATKVRLKHVVTL